MNRLYVVESTHTNTGAMADHRLPLRAGDVEGFARALAEAVGAQPGGGGNAAPPGLPGDWIPALSRDLQKHRGACLILAGEQQPAAVHALAHLLNDALGNVGKTVTYTTPVEANPVNQTDSLRQLVTDIGAGQVDTLLILGGNPVYNAPAELEFGKQLLKVRMRIRLGLHDDETGQLCHWRIPEAHYLESWSDARAFDGTVSIIQPLISPLYDGKSAHELVAVLAGEEEVTGHGIIRSYWQKQRPGGDFENFWQKSLNDGVVEGTALPAKPVKAQAGLRPPAGKTAAAPNGNLEIVLRPDPNVWDGSFCNNSWLQELPRPLTKLTWDDAALLSPATAIKLRVTNGDVVKLHDSGREVTAPVWITPGNPDDSITLHLGYGRWHIGHVGGGVGFDAYRLRTAARPWITSATVQKTGETHQLVTTQHHHIMGKEGKQIEEESVAALQRKLVRAATLEEFRRDPNFAQEKDRELVGPSMYPGYPYQGNAWGMSIDLNSCTGCNACIVACYSENNIAVVGKDEVARGRDMQWIRLDAYFEGSLANPVMYNQPVPCMHCENAPCEYVCPVGATVHSPEGLNEMIYNRCVGTRYCSNNCPYKVRRFNFELFSDWTTQSLKLQRNPDVTVRSRGVMEKCSYCIQRINRVKIAAEEAGREIRDGEILTACQQTCPTQAIVFGNINDADSRVAKLKAQSRNYGILTDLNTRPRTTYLGKLRNPNPEIKE